MVGPSPKHGVIQGSARWRNSGISGCSGPHRGDPKAISTLIPDDTGDTAIDFWCPGISWIALVSQQISTDLNSLASPGFGQGGSSQMRLRPASAEQAMEYLSDTQPTLGLSTPPEAGWQVSLSSIYLDFLSELLWFCHKCCHLPFHSFTAVCTTWNDHWNHQNWVDQCMILTWKSLWRPLIWQIIEMFCSQKLLEN